MWGKEFQIKPGRCASYAVDVSYQVSQARIAQRSRESCEGSVLTGEGLGIRCVPSVDDARDVDSASDRPLERRCAKYSSRSDACQHHGKSLVNTWKRSTTRLRPLIVATVSPRASSWLRQPASIASKTCSSARRRATFDAPRCRVGCYRGFACKG